MTNRCMTPSEVLAAKEERAALVSKDAMTAAWHWSAAAHLTPGENATARTRRARMSVRHWRLAGRPDFATGMARAFATDRCLTPAQRDEVGLGWGFVGQGATFFGTVLPLALVAGLGYAAYRWGYYALTGRSAPTYEGVPHASKVWD